MAVAKGSTASSVTFTESEIRSFNKYIANSSDFFLFNLRRELPHSKGPS